MISIVVYGRNDNHGYNLHKRVALSINSFAEVLTHDNDEILFVDYNTPDEYPSLIETIQDTLTDKARRCVRVIRAFASVHRQYARETPFAVVEAIARNIGFRRSNPANRWILSTNTDMILVPRDAKKSFSDIARDLPDGFYLLPRFELPEAMWELYDRKNAADVVARTRDWGTRFALNEVINRALVRYDAPGDFQLALRKDIFELSGMDERMLLGNIHVDSNLCRRMVAKRGQLDSLVDHMFGYHCSHTRTATFVHSRNSVANEFERFVREVKEWRLPHQENTWGQPNGRVEEIRLGAPGESPYQTVLKQHVKPLDIPFDELTADISIQESLRYRLDHMLPYLASAIAPLPKDASIGLSLCRHDVLDKFVGLWRSFGFTGTVGVRAADVKRLDASALVQKGALSAIDEPAFFETFDYHLFEFGLASSADQKFRNNSLEANWAQRDAEGLSTVLSTLRGFIAAEGARPASAPPRRCLFIGAANNQFEPIVNDHFDVTFSPFTSRVRQGFLHRAAKPAANESFDPSAIARTLAGAGRGRAPSTGEIVRIWHEVQQMLRGERIQYEVESAHLALLKAVGAGPMANLDPTALEKAVEAIEAQRLSRTYAPRIEANVAEPAGAANALSKFADPMDWEDEEWFANVEWFFGGSAAYDVFHRHRDVWIGGQILYGLQKLGLSANSHVAVVTEHADNLYAALSQMTGTVDVIRSAFRGPLLSDEQRDRWLATPTPARPSAIRILDEPLWRTAAGQTDFVVLARNAAQTYGLAGLIDALAASDRTLREGGVCALALEVRVGGKRNEYSIDVTALKALVADLECETGWRTASGIDLSLSPHALDHTINVKTDLHRPHFIRDRDGGLTAPVVLFFRKTAATSASAWEKTKDAVAAASLGPIADRMLFAEPFALKDGRLHIEPGAPSEVVAFGPYVTLPEGGYCVELSISPDTDAPDDQTILGIEIVGDDRRTLFQRDVTAREARAGAIKVEFFAPSTAEMNYLRLELRLRTLGGAGQTIKIGDLAASATAKTRPDIQYDLLVRNALGASARAAGETVIVEANAPHGHFLYGPYVRLAQGWWRLTLAADMIGADDLEHGVVNLEILYGPDRIVPPIVKLTPKRAARGPLTLDFFVPTHASDTIEPPAESFEIRLLFLGGAQVKVRAFSLRSLDAAPPADPTRWAFNVAGVLADGQGALWLSAGEWTASAASAATLSLVHKDEAIAGPIAVGTATRFAAPRRVWDGAMHVKMTGADDVVLAPADDLFSLRLASAPTAEDVPSLAITGRRLIVNASLGGDGVIAAKPPTEPGDVSVILGGFKAPLHALKRALAGGFRSARYQFAEADFNWRRQSMVRAYLMLTLWIVLFAVVRLRARPVIVEIFDLSPKRAGPFGADPLRRALLLPATQVIVHSEGDRATLARLFPRAGKRAVVQAPPRRA